MHADEAIDYRPMTDKYDSSRGGLVDADRLMRVRQRLQAINAALDGYSDVARRRVARRVEQIAELAPYDLDAAEEALERLERGMER